MTMGKGTFRAKSAYFTAAFLLPLAVFTVLMDLPSARFDVPVGFDQHVDILNGAPFFKAWVDGQNPFLADNVGAPVGTNIFVHPMNAHVNILLLLLTSLLFDGYGAIINAAWLLTRMITGVTATWSLRKLDVSAPVAMLGGLLYVFLPINTFNGVWYYNLSCMFAPVAAMAALRLLDGSWGEMARRERLVCWGVCLLLGFNDPYEAFFCCIILCSVAGALFFARRFRAAMVPAAMVCVIVGCGVVNAVPAMMARQDNPETISSLHKAFRNPKKVVENSLDIGTFFLPVPNHPVKPLGDITKTVVPHANGWRASKVGGFATLGMIVLAAALLRAAVSGSGVSRREQRLRGAACLAVILLMVCARYGFNLLISVFITSQIRCYDRVAIVVGFFCLIGFCALLDMLFRPPFQNRRRAFAYGLLLAGLAGVGIADQLETYHWKYVRNWQSKVPEWDDMTALARQIEAGNPRAMIYNADVRLAPEKGGNYRKPYLATKGLRWTATYMGSGDAVQKWHRWAFAQPLDKRLLALLLADFDGVWLDMRGKRDAIAQYTSQWGALPGVKTIDSPEGRFKYLDIAPLRKALEEKTGPEAWAAAHAAVMDAKFTDWARFQQLLGQLPR